MAYTIEYGKTPCEHCGIGGTWDIVGPDGVAIGVSFGDKTDAEEWAGTLSRAYELGKGSAPSWDDAVAALAHGDIHEALIGHIGGVVSPNQASMGAIRSILRRAADYLAANKPKAEGGGKLPDLVALLSTDDALVERVRESVAWESVQDDHPDDIIYDTLYLPGIVNATLLAVRKKAGIDG